MSERFPRWVDAHDEVMLREVAPDLFVGAVGSSPVERWAGIVALYGYEGSPLDADRARAYLMAKGLLFRPVHDGRDLPTALLDAALVFARRARAEGPVLVHCQAGLSRSASVAYALLRVMDGVPHAEALRRVRVPPFQLVFPRERTLESARRWAEERLARRGVPRVAR